MKDMVAKIKTADYKQLAIDHGEKIFAGMLGLLLALSLVATSWSRYDRTPAELTQKVSSARTVIAQSSWPDSEQKLYALTAGLQEVEVRNLLNDDDNKRADFVKQMQGDYEYRTPIFASPYARIEPSREPDLLAPIEPIATAGRALVSFTPEEQLFTEVDPDESEEDPEDLLIRRSNFGTGIGIDPSMDKDGQLFGKGYGPDAAGGVLGMGMGGFAGAVQNARGMRFVSVRAIVPLYRQIEKFKIALGLALHNDAAERVVYFDFVLQRRSKPATGTQDYSAFEAVDLRTAKDVLEEAAGWDPLINDVAITDPVLTMNLVTRVVRYWSKEEASHPRVDNYALPPRQRELQMEMLSEFLDQNIEIAQNEKKLHRRGLSDTQRNVSGGFAGSGGGYGVGATGGGYGVGANIGMKSGPRGLGDRAFSGASSGLAGLGPSAMLGRGRVRGMSSGQVDTSLGAIAKRLNKDNPEKIKEDMLKQLLKSQNASGRLLLFRYIDFDVKPATTYQYQVKLVLVNPNFNQPTQNLIDPEIGKQEFLETPMSEPTPPVTVPEDIKFYLARVDGENGANPPSAMFNVFQWSTEYGTTINKKLKVYYGAFVGERTEAEVLDPAGNTFEDEDVEFMSNDVLVDVSKAPLSIKAADHPDLQQLPLEKLKKGLGVAEQALLVNQFGDLVAYDPISLQLSLEKAQRDLEKERKPFQDLKDRAQATDAEGVPDFSKYEGKFGAGMMGAGMMGAGMMGLGGDSLRKGKRSRKNPLRKGKKGKSSRN